MLAGLIVASNHSYEGKLWVLMNYETNMYMFILIALKIWSLNESLKSSLQTCYISMWRMWFSWSAIYIRYYSTSYAFVIPLSIPQCASLIMWISFLTSNLKALVWRPKTWVITSHSELLHVENIICFNTVQSQQTSKK